MKTYNPINTTIFILTGVFLLILLSIEFDSTLYSIIQCSLILLSLPVLKTTHYDFDKFYNENIKRK